MLTEPDEREKRESEGERRRMNTSGMGK